MQACWFFTFKEGTVEDFFSTETNPDIQILVKGVLREQQQRQRLTTVTSQSTMSKHWVTVVQKYGKPLSIYYEFLISCQKDILVN